MLSFGVNVLALAAILVDQIGYPTAAPKLAMVTSPAERFSVHAPGGATALEGALSAPMLDPDSGDRIRIADFSSIRTPGTYELRAGGETATVTVTGNPYDSVLRLATHAFYGQRCGTAVDLGGGYSHAACHLNATPAGGWHDAGDYGRYVVNSAVATGTLLWAAELFGADVLDEVRWNLRWMLSMQDADGSVWHKQTSNEFPPFLAPEDDHSEIRRIGKSSCATADFAAVMAIAARVDPSDADRYLTASRRAWAWLQEHPNVTFRNPREVKTGEYGDRDCSDERLWAAAELFRTTGEGGAYVRAHAIALNAPPSWRNVGPLSLWTYALSGRGDERVVEKIRQESITAADAIVARAQSHAYRIPFVSRDYVWGSNGVAANYGLQLLVANALQPDRRYVDAAYEILHYLLGRNTFAISWVTGTGTRSVQHPHHRPSGSDAIDAPWPGLLAGGPNKNRQDPVLRALPANLPPARVYSDDQASFSSNEVAINWNASLVFVAAGVSGRAAVFRAQGFPTVDAPAIPDAAFEGLEAISSLDELTNQKVLVLPYGSAFPIDQWPALRDFVSRGGSLVVLGGAPLHQPVLRTKDGWQLGTRQPKYAHELLIGPAEAVKTEGLRTVLPDSRWTLPVDGAHTVWEMTIRLATKPEFPDEGGSEGPREGVVRPLVHLVDADGIPRACPLLEIDRRDARWIFAPTDAPLTRPLIHAIIARAFEGPSHLEARPVLASLESGETPRIRLSERADIIVRDDSGHVVDRQTGDGVANIRGAGKPGLYHVEVTTAKAKTTTGFWVRDAALLDRGPKLTVSRDWLRRDGKVFPIIGTTYMASDVHRQFLFEPNPHVWDRDFAQMKRLGVNFVRTGIWTGWSRASGEPFLRALDAYVQTAAKHDIIVAFTFYAFLPLPYGGVNPYLDPKSLERQRAFVTSIAKRFRGVGWIHYDLINEPSYAPPEGLWSNRPIGDAFEKQAWAEWLKAGKREDFTEFSHEVVARWAAQLRVAIREAGGDVLVTLGQDEGGTGQRPSQQIHAPSVDYTCIHPWWQNENVLANGIAAKVPEKPSLFQEVGLMRLEDANGWPVRSAELSADMIERKFAYAFASRSSGAVEWAWNINPYMPIDNESVIGFFRPDGTAKPELRVIPDFAAFFEKAAPLLDDFEPDPVVIVFPQSQIFANVKGAADSYNRAVHILAERFGIVPTAISDLRLTPERLRDAKVVIRPDAFDVESLSKVQTYPSDTGVAMRLLHAPRATLGIYVNETSKDAVRNGVMVPAGRARLVLYDRGTGSVLLQSGAAADPAADAARGRAALH